MFLQTNSVFTEESQRCVKSTNPFTKKRGRPVVMGQSIVLSARRVIKDDASFVQDGRKTSHSQEISVIFFLRRNLFIK